MAIASRIESLKARRAVLKAQKEVEEARPCPNEFLLAKIGKQSLKLKDEIMHLALQNHEGEARATG